LRRVDRPLTFLLTLLALLTGLSAAPAQARTSAAEAAGIEHVQPRPVVTVAALAVSARIAGQAMQGPRVLHHPAPAGEALLVPNRAIEGSDRALE
jgi:hypothetical protein